MSFTRRSDARRNLIARTLALVVPILFLGASVGTALAKPDPGAVVVHNPFRAVEPSLLEGLAEEQAAALRDVLNPVWFSGDPVALQKFLAEHYDAAKDKFTFTGPTAANDASLARTILDEVHLYEQMAYGQTEEIRKLIEHLFVHGRPPEGWVVVDENGNPILGEETEAGGEPGAPEGDGLVEELPDTDAPPPEGYMADAPVPGWLGGEEGPGAEAEEKLHFFETNCPKCDQYLFRSSSPITITFDIGKLGPQDIREAALDISAYDVDWGSTGCPAGPERDAVLLNGNFVGYLTGADSSWSTSSYNLDPNWFKYGVNTVAVDIDAPGTGCWAVQVDWIDVTINAPTGPIIIFDQKTDKDAYNFGEQIKVETFIETNEDKPQSGKVEWNLVQPDGNILQTLSQSVTVSKGNPQKLSKTLSIPSSGKEGLWTVVSIAYDKDGAKSDERPTNVAVGTDLVIKDDDITFKILDSNPKSGIQKVEVTVNWKVNTKITTPQKYNVEIAIESAGSRAPIEKISRSDTGGDQKVTKTFEVRAGSRVEVILDTANDLKEAKEDNNKAEKSLCNPKVKEATPSVEGHYYNDVKLEVEWTAEVEEDKAPGCKPVEKVVYSFDGTEAESRAKGENWKLKFDMGKIDAGLNRKLKVYAVDGDGNKGDPLEKTLKIWALPEFVVWGWKGPVNKRFGVEFSIAIEGKAAKFTIGFDITLMERKIDIPGKIPVLGGKWGAEVKFSASVEFSTKGDYVKLSVSIGGDFEAGSKNKVGLEGAGEGTWKWDEPKGFRLDKLTATFKLSWTSPPLKWRPPPFPVVEFSIKLKVTGAAKFIWSDKGTPKFHGLGWDHFEFSVTVAVTIKALLGADALGLSASATPSIKPTFQNVDPILKSVTFNIKIEVKGHFLMWEKTFFEMSWDAVYNGYLPADRPWALPARDWISRPGYAAFVAQGADGDVVSDLYPWGNPRSASNSLGHILTAYTHDDAGKSRPQSADPYYTFFDGSTWSVAAAITSATFPDFEAAVALDEADVGAAVWVRFEDDNLPESAVLPELGEVAEIYYATWTKATGWTEPRALTDNAIADFEPSIVADGEGGFLVAWMSDPNNEFFTPEQLNRQETGPLPLPTRDLHVARIAPGIPATPPATIASGVTVVGAPRVTPLATGAFLYLYGTDGDGDERTWDDATLHAQPGLVAGGLGGAIEVAKGAIREPQFAIGSALPVVAWITQSDDDGDRVRARDVTQVLPNLGVPGVVIGQQYTLAEDATQHPVMNGLGVRVDSATGDRIVTWIGSAVEGDGQQVYYTVTPAGGIGAVPAPISPLTPEDELAWRAGSALVRNPDGTRTLRVVSLNEPAGGADGAADSKRSSLASVSKRLLPDAEIASLSPAVLNPAPGTKVNVTVVVRNVGDVDLEAMDVQLLDNGNSVGKKTVGILRRGAAETYRFEWTVPADDVAHELVAKADPDGRLVEATEFNNERSLITVLPDLSVASAGQTDAGGEFRVEAVLVNRGVRDAPAGEAVLVFEATGAVLGTFAHGKIAPGESLTLDVTPDIGIVPAEGGFAVLSVAPDEDVDPKNNRKNVQLTTAPDLRIQDRELFIGSRFAGSVPASVVVHNVGIIASKATTLHVYDGLPASEGSVPIATATVPALAVGGNAEVSFAFPGKVGEREYFFQVGGHPDLNPTDNTLGRILTLKGRPDGAVADGSLAFEPGGLRVTVFNRGDAEIPAVSFNLYNGYPQSVPKYGLKYVTEVKTLVGRGAVSNVPAQGSASTVLPLTGLDLGQIPRNGLLYVWLDPDQVADDTDRGNNVAFTTMLSVVSTTHPDPATSYMSSTAAFALSVKPGFSYGGVSYVLDRNPGTVPDTLAESTTATTLSFSGLANGDWYLHARGLVAGAWTDATHVRVRVSAVDNVPPTSKLLIYGPWAEDDGMTYMGDNVPLILTARDVVQGTAGVSGVVQTRYAIDGVWSTYTGPFFVTAPGEHTVEWKAIDAAGNVEPVKSRRFFIERDTHAPETTLTGVLDRDGIAYLRPGAPISLASIDPKPYFARFAAGLDRIEFRINGGAWTTYTSPFTLTGADGQRLVEYRAIDKLGNVERTHSLPIFVDGTAPQTTILSHVDDQKIVGKVTFVVNAVDAGVGMDRVELYREDLLVATVAGPDGDFNVTVDTGFWYFGYNHLTFRGIDRWGNSVDVPLKVYVISRNAPIWKDPKENLDRYLPKEVRERVPV